LTHPDRNHLQLTGAPKIMLNARQMRALPLCFTTIVDPRCPQGRLHRLPVVLGIAAGAILCGMRGYKAISDWADALGQKARERFGCRHKNRHYVAPSEFVIRDCLIRIEPGVLDRALNAWNRAWGVQDNAPAIDGKTMKNATDEAAHTRGVFGQESALGDDVQTCEKAQPLVGDMGHHVTAVFDGPQLEDQHRAQCMAGGDHLRAGESCRLGKLVQSETHQAWNEQEQATAGGVEAARGERELAHVGGGLDGGARSLGTFFVEPAR
jgi:hypothetical protein